MIFKKLISNKKMESQEFQSFLTCYIKPILVQNDELKKENEKFKNLFMEHGLEFHEVEQMLKHFLCGTTNNQYEKCAVCHRKFFCTECEIDYSTLCDKCDKLICFDCIIPDQPGTTCKNC